MLQQSGIIKKGDLLNRWFKNRFDKNKNVLIAVTGSTGSGKSWVSHAILNEWYQYKFKIDFPVETHTCFSINEFVMMLNKGKLRKGEFLILEEAGTSLNALDYRDNISKLFTFILQSFRSMNIGIIFNLPVLTFLNKSSRLLLHAHFITAGIDFKNKLTIIKPLFHQLNQERGKSYWKYLRAQINGDVTIIERLAYGKPPEDVLELYEKKKFKFVSALTRSFAAELEHKYREETYKYVRKELSPRAKRIYKLRCEGMTFQQIADIETEKYGRITGQGCWGIEQTYLKNGYDPKSEEKLENP